MSVQVVLNGLIASSIWALVGLGFGVVFSTVRFFHFAHGAVVTAGAYFAFLFAESLGVPLVPACGIAVLCCSLLGCAIHWTVYRPLLHRRSPSLVLLLASLGVFIVLQNTISLIWGDDIRRIRTDVMQEGIDILGGRATPVQLFTIILTGVLFSAVATFMKRTATGRAMRAMANDQELARIVGVHTDRVLLASFALGSALSGVAGILIALDVDMTPAMGLRSLMMGVVAVVIGGAGSIRGVILGALLLGMSQHIGAAAIGTHWQDTIAFVILSLFLLFRPTGFMGKTTASTRPTF